MASRVPVISIGSNAAPAQLRYKLIDSGATTVVPNIQATVFGLSIVFSASISPYGAIPWTVAIDDTASGLLFVQFLDQMQLDRMDETESGYSRIWYDGRILNRPPIILNTGEALEGAFLYVADGGSLTDNGRPLTVFPEKSTLATKQSVDHRKQDDLIDFLVNEIPQIRPIVMNSHGGPKESITSSQQNRFSELLRQYNRVQKVDNEFRQFPISRKYGEGYASLLPSIPDVALDLFAEKEEQVGVAIGTDMEVKHHGQSVIGVSKRLYTELGRPTHVSIRNASLDMMFKRHARFQAPATIGQVIVIENMDRLQGRNDVVQVDEVLCSAIGCYYGDHVILKPAIVPGAPVSKKVFGSLDYLVARVTYADPTVTERDACLLSSLSLQMLGIASGDQVVIEGLTVIDNFPIPTITVKAFEIPIYLRSERMAIMGGTWGSSYPSACDAMGIAPDIPLMFIDKEKRSILGIDGTELPAVRVRPAPWPRLLNEIRELLLMLAIAFVGMVSLLQNKLIISCVLLGFLLLMLFIVVGRLRRVLSHQLSIKSPHSNQKKSDNSKGNQK